MRRAAWLALLFLSIGLHAQTLPAPLGPEHSVSAVEPTGSVAAGTPLMATNGRDVALVVWQDMREGSPAIYATRLNVAGQVLDPFAVRVGSGSPLSTVVWNGGSFAVIAGTTLALVAPDRPLVVTKSLDLPPNSRFIAATKGLDPRFLFFEPQGTAAIMDSQGNRIAEIQLDAARGGLVLAGGNETSFLVLQNNLATHIDRDGNLLSIVDAQISNLAVRQFGTLVGGTDGFLLAGFQSAGNETQVVVHWFSPAGVHAAARVVATLPAGQYGASLDVIRDGSRYLLVWTSNDINSGNATEFTAAVDADPTVASTSNVSTTSLAKTRTSGVALVATFVSRLVATNVAASPSGGGIFVQTLSDTLELSSPRLVTSIGTTQRVTGIASGANGYAVFWAEAVAENVAHSYVRRFSENGTPQDAAPIRVADSFSTLSLSSQAAIVSNGETYLLAWRTTTDFVVRRLSARSGEWIDPEPVPLGISVVSSQQAVAASQTDALVLGNSRCGSNRCITARRINLSGPPLTSPPILLRQLDPLQTATVAIGSNGTDYLALWEEEPECMLGACVPNPGQLYVLRLRGDGTSLDAQPARLNSQPRPVWSLTVAHAAGRYLAAWSEQTGIRGTRVTTEGAVLDAEPVTGGVLLAANEPYSLTVHASAFGGTFVLLLRHVIPDSSGPLNSLEVVAFDAQADLASVAARPRTLVAAPDRNFDRDLVGAGRGLSFALAYDRLDPEAGNVPRTFLRLFSEAPTRRRAAH